MTLTILQAAHELTQSSYPLGSCIDLHRPTGFYKISKEPGGIFSQCRDSKGSLHPKQCEIPITSPASKSAR
jgi:hypothetical protein